MESRAFRTTRHDRLRHPASRCNGLLDPPMGDLLRPVLAGAEVDEVLPGGEAEDRRAVGILHEGHALEIVPVGDGEAHEGIDAEPPVFPRAVDIARPVLAGIVFRRHKMGLNVPLLPLMGIPLGIEGDVEAALSADKIKDARTDAKHEGYSRQHGCWRQWRLG